MKLKDQVTSLELSKRLKELGVRQESLFFYTKTDYDGKDFQYELKIAIKSNFRQWGSVDGNTKLVGKQDSFSAFTVAELGEILPRVCYSYKPLNSAENYTCYWQVEGHKKYEPYQLKRLSFGADTEADARAKMLVYLLENKLIK